MSSLDWAIITVYLGVILVLGLCASRRVNTLRDYFLAGNRLGVWLVVISIIATETSAATVIGGPDTSYSGNLAYLQTTIGAVLSRFFLAYFFIDVYYRHEVYTVYGYLAKRFGPIVQGVSAALFCVARLLASGARLYIAAFAVSTIASVELYEAILLTGAVALLYGVAGGLRAVVWTDVIQGLLFLGVGLYSLFFIVDGVGGAEVFWSEVSSSDKFVFFDFDFNIFSLEFWKNPYTFIGAVLGGFTLGVATHGTDQDMVQRMLACRTSREGRRSLVLTGLIEIPVALLFVSLGLALWTYYQHVQVMGPEVTDPVFPHFIRNSLPSGMKGLMLAAILAAAMSSLDSALTALSSVSVVDVYLPLLRREVDDREDDEGLAGENQKKIVLRARWLSLFWGLLLIVTALFLGYYHQGLLAASVPGMDIGRKDELLTLALGVMSSLYGPLLGVFLIAIFTKRGSTTSVLVGMAMGLLGVGLIRYGLFGEIGWTWHVVIGCLITVLAAGSVRRPAPPNTAHQ